jgi:hypothetical protein
MIVEGKSGRPSRSVDKLFAFSRLPRGEKIGTSNGPLTNLKEETMQGEIDSKRLIWPGLAGLYQSISPYSYAIIRFAAGAVVIYHGYAKLFLGFADDDAGHRLEETEGRGLAQALDAGAIQHPAQ